MEKNNIYDTSIRLFLLFVMIAWCLMIMAPFINIMLWSIVQALALFPIHKKLSGKLGGKPGLAACIIVSLILFIIILPSGFLVYTLIDDVKAFKVSYDTGNLVIPPPAENIKEWPLIGDKLYNTWYSASVNLDHFILTYKDQLVETGSKIAKGVLNTAGGVLQVLISLIIAGVLLVYDGAGKAFRKFFRKVAGNKGDVLADLTLMTVGNVVRGILLEGIILAFMHGIVFLLAGVPYAGIWTFLVFVLCILQIPVYFLTASVIIYFFASFGTMPAVLWSILLLLVSMSDNILTPIMLGKGAPVPMLVVFTGVIGGFVLFGFIGLFTGAIIMSVGYTLFVDWLNSNDVEPELTSSPERHIT